GHSFIQSIQRGAEGGCDGDFEERVVGLAGALQCGDVSVGHSVSVARDFVDVSGEWRGKCTALHSGPTQRRGCFARRIEYGRRETFAKIIVTHAGNLFGHGFLTPPVPTCLLNGTQSVSPSGLSPRGRYAPFNSLCQCGPGVVAVVDRTAARATNTYQYSSRTHHRLHYKTTHCRRDRSARRQQSADATRVSLPD